MVFFTDPNTGRFAVSEVFYDIPATDPTRLELLPDRDGLLMPVGVGGQVVADAGGASPFIPVGVVMFDGFGRMTVRSYKLTGTLLAARLGTLPAGASNTGLSQFGFILYDLPGYTDQSAVSATAGSTWLASNAVAFLVNRYNGTLMRSE